MPVLMVALVAASCSGSTWVATTLATLPCVVYLGEPLMRSSLGRAMLSDAIGAARVTSQLRRDGRLALAASNCSNGTVIAKFKTDRDVDGHTQHAASRWLERSGWRIVALMRRNELDSMLCNHLRHVTHNRHCVIARGCAPEAAFANATVGPFACEPTLRRLRGNWAWKMEAMAAMVRARSESCTNTLCTLNAARGSACSRT